MRGRLIAIEGIDQSGKSTQARLLEMSLRRDGFEVGSISFPVYKSASGRLIKDYLDSNRSFSFPALCMLYSLNRWEQLDSLKHLLGTNDFVISSRYSPSGLVYGTAGKLSPSWLRNLDAGLPAPKIVLVLDVPVKTSKIRKPTQRDAHERNLGYLRIVRHNYLKFAKKNGWQIVPGTGPVQSVSGQILARVRREFATTL